MSDSAGGSRTITDNAAEGRYEIRVDGDLAGYAAYRDVAGVRVLTHTKVDDDYEGQGVGSALAKGVLDDVRERGLRALPRCPFIAAYVQRHHEYDDILD